MALDFSVLQGIDPGGAFLEGRERAAERADRNLLRQAKMEQMAAQRENMLAQRQEREAHAEERRLGAARRQEEDAWLGKMADLFGQNGVQLTPETVQQGLAFALRSRNPAAIQMMQKTVEAMQARQQQIEEDARAEAELARITGRSTGAAPSVMRQPAAAMPAAPAAPPNLLAGTPYDIGVGAPAPVNALAVPAPAPAAPAGFTRDQVQQMLTSPSARIREQGKALVATLPKDQQPRLQDRFVPVGRLVFNRETQQFITPPAAAIAATQDRGAGAAAAPKAPRGYRFTADGELEPIPGGPAAPKPMSPVQEAARRDKIGKEFKAAQTALQTTQDVLDAVSFVRNESGLNRALGFTGMLPSFPGGQAASAEVRLENLKGKVTALGKAAAAATGAIGQIANQEWKILADQIAIIDKIKGEGPLLAQLDLIEAQAKGAMERIRDAYQRQFGEDFERFPQFAELPAPKSVAPRRGAQSQVAPAPASGPRAAPAAPAAAPLTPAEQAELDALRQRFRRPPQ